MTQSKSSTCPDCGTAISSRSLVCRACYLRRKNEATWQANRGGPNLSGVCLCGCGQATPLATRDYPELGIRSGQPMNYVQGHTSRRIPRYFCVFCGKPFAGRTRGRYCSIACRGKWRPITEGMPIGVVGVPLKQGYIALIDAADLPKVIDTRWSLHDARGRSYARGKINGKWTYMHRLLLGLTEDDYCDHIKGNGLDNRRSNLRSATPAQNTYNKAPRTCRSYKGITPAQKQGSWIAQIRKEGRTLNLGTYENAEDAARAYDKKARELFGQFAHLNFPDEEAA